MVQYMNRPDEICQKPQKGVSGNHFIQTCGIRLGCIILYVQHSDFQNALTERDFQNIPLFHIIGRFCRSAIHRDVRGIASIVGNRPSFNDPGYFQVFIKSQFNLSFNALPQVKTTRREAGIVMVALVAGLRPVRAALSLTAKLPNPTIWKPSPATNASSKDS